MEDSTKRKNGATPQHRVRYGQIIPVALGILHYANRVREIIDGTIQWMVTRKHVLIIQAKSNLIN